MYSFSFLLFATIGAGGFSIDDIIAERKRVG